MNLSSLALHHQKVVVRLDLNVPVRDNVITDDSRLIHALPTLRYLIEQNCSIVILSHFGRPEEGQFDKKYSLQFLVEPLSTLLNQTVSLCSKFEDINSIKTSIVLFENVRFFKGESSCDSTLSEKFALLGDIFINDAFAVCHRKHSSVTGMAAFFSKKAYGFLVEKELKQLKNLKKENPSIALIGGVKIKDKIDFLIALVDMMDALLIGGALAFPFLRQQGYFLGSSINESDDEIKAKEVISYAKEKNVRLLTPIDGFCAKTPQSKSRYVSFSDIQLYESIFDIGPQTISLFAKEIACAKTLLWNGAMGVFEEKYFQTGTKAIINEITKSQAYSLVGGGETLLALKTFQQTEGICAVSTGGGALLKYIESGSLPGLDALQ